VNLSWEVGSASETFIGRLRYDPAAARKAFASDIIIVAENNGKTSKAQKIDMFERLSSFPSTPRPNAWLTASQAD
jgi:hypothetical protein